MNDARNAHLATLGLVRNPFPYTPDAGCYFSTPHLEEQLVELEHCVVARKGILLLTAEVGMGKSTLVRRLMADLADRNVVSALVFNTFLQGPELLEAVLHDFGLESTGSLAADINTLNQFLLDNHRAGRTCLLVIDDAQNLSDSSLELMRLLCNLETDQEKLLQILLAGQPELETSLAQHSMRQLRSRLVKHARLHGLHSTEMADYVRFRLESAGSDGTLKLSTEACQMLWRETQGVPRHIHLIMDRCLYGLAARRGRVIDAALMQEAIEDSRVSLGGPVAPAPMTEAEPAPVAKPRRPAYAAVVVGLALAIGAWMYWGDRVTALAPAQAHAVASVSSEPVASAAVESDPAPVADTEPPAPQAPASCDDRLSREAESPVISQPLPDKTYELFGARLERLDDVCVEQRDEKTWVSWQGPASGHALEERVVAARFQIALTRYGSLPSNEVDGIWGARSRRSLMQFQEEVGLEPTGEADPVTGLLLERFYAH